MKNKVFDTAKARMEELQSENSVELKTAKEQIAQAQAMQREAYDEAVKCYEKADTKGYHKAQDASREAKDIIDMFTSKVERLKNDPLITEEEYNTVVNSIMTEQASIVKEAKKRIATLIDQMEEISNDVLEKLEVGNSLLYKWQHDIFKDHAEIKNAAGKCIHIEGLEKHFNDYSVVQYVSQQKKSFIYQDATKDR